MKKMLKTLISGTLILFALPVFASPVYQYSPDFFDSAGQYDCTSTVEEQVAKLVKDQSTVTQIGFLPTYGAADEDTPVVGYEGWVSFSSCVGNLVIKMDKRCRIKHVYTRYECQIDGVPHY